jgi:hypothetical protein
MNTLKEMAPVHCNLHVSSCLDRHSVVLNYSNRGSQTLRGFGRKSNSASGRQDRGRYVQQFQSSIQTFFSTTVVCGIVCDTRPHYDATISWPDSLELKQDEVPKLILCYT